MAALIAKIVRKAVNSGRSVYPHQSGRSNRKSYAKVHDPAGDGTSSSAGAQSISFGNDVEIQKSSTSSNVPLAYFPGETGIMKTVTTTVVAENNRDYRMSR